MSVKNISFSIEEKNKEKVFIAHQNGDKIYEANIDGIEMDIFDCIEMFMDDHKSLFRNKKDRIKWTTTTV